MTEKEQKRLYRDPIAWMALNPIASNLLMAAFILGGIFLGYHTYQEVFPEIAVEKITVTVSYPGASPDEVEQGVIFAIENEVKTLEGIKKIESKVSEGGGIVTIHLLEGVAPNQMLQEVQARVDSIQSFPRDAERPIILSLIHI